MYESDWFDEMYMDYRRDHPFDKEDRKFWLKVWVGVVFLIGWAFLQDNGYLNFKDKTPQSKEIKANQSNQINPGDTIKYLNQNQR